MPPKSPLELAQERAEKINQLLNKQLPPKPKTDQPSLDTNWRRTLTQGVNELKDDLNLTPVTIANILENRYKKEKLDNSDPKANKRALPRNPDVFSDETVKNLLGNKWPSVDDRQHKLIRIITSIVLAYPERELDVSWDEELREIIFSRGENELSRGPIDDPSPVAGKAQNKANSLPTHRYYIAYYWRHRERREQERVGYTLVSIRLDEQGKPLWRTTQVTVAYSSFGEIITEQEVNLKDVRLKTVDSCTSSINDQQKLVFLWLADEEWELEKRTDNDAVIFSQITLNYEGNRDKWLIGTYGTAHRSTRSATAGVMVWQPIGSEPEAKRLIRSYKEFDRKATQNAALPLEKQASLSPVIPAAVRNYLLHQRLDTPRIRDLVNEIQLPQGDKVHIYSLYKGKYQGYTIRLDNPDNVKVSLFGVDIREDGTVKVSYDKPESPKQLDGIIQYADESVWINLDYKPELRGYRQSYLLRTSAGIGPGPTRRFTGILCGLSRDLRHPEAGHILLTELAEGSFKIENHSVSHFFKLDPELKILSVLTGLEDVIQSTRYMTDSFGPGLLRTLPKTTDETGLNEWAGNFQCFIGDMEDDGPYHIKRFDLQISDEGDAVIMKHNETIWKGTLEIIPNEALLMQFSVEAHDSFAGTLLIKLGSGGAMVKPGKFKRLYGIFSRTANERVEAFSVVMIPSNQALPEAEELNADSRFMRLDVKNLPEREGNARLFDENDENLGGLLSFMEGAANRSLRMKATPDRPLRPRLKEYRRVPFFAACYLASIYPEMESKLKNLEENLKGTPLHDKGRLAALVQTVKGQRQANSDHVKLVKDHLMEAFRMGFAANKFAGIVLTDTHTEDDGIVKDFAKLGLIDKAIGLIDPKKVNELKQIIEDVLEDQRMLKEAAEPNRPLSHKHFDGRCQDLWPHLFETQKPEAPQ